MSNKVSNKSQTRRKPSDLALVTEARDEFAHLGADPKLWGKWPDSKVHGLFIQIGPQKSTWRYFSQARVKGNRTHAYHTLGYFPAMTVSEARKQALIHTGAIHAGTAAPAKKQQMPFVAAFESYLEHLRAQAIRKGKEPRWYDNARKLYDTHIKPEWQNWTLYDMSQNPRTVKTWYDKLHAKTPTTADHCIRLIRASYKMQADLDRSLPSALPTSGVKLRKIKVREKAMAVDQFAAWAKAWQKIESPVRRGYHLTGLLIGARPGELARVRKEDWDRKAHTLTLRNIKSRGDEVKDLTIPTTPQIEYALQLALDAPPQIIVQRGLKGMRKGEKRVLKRPAADPGLIFPGCRQMPARSRLPFAGHALRHSWKSLATAIGVPDILSALLLGHSVKGAAVVSVSGVYISGDAVLKTPQLREVQEKISAHIFDLLGLKLPSPPLVPEASSRKVRKTTKISTLAQS